MPNCPHCQVDIVLRQLQHQGMWKNYRVCPACGGQFTVDAKTRQRQALALVLALVALVLTGLLYFRGAHWLTSALIIYAVLAAVIYRGNQQLYLVARGNQQHGANE